MPVPSADSFDLSDLLRSEQEAEQTGAACRLSDYGLIADVEIPAGWVSAFAPDGEGLAPMRLWHEFHPANLPEARLYFYYRGSPVSDVAAGRFSALLQQTAHALTEQEVQSLSEILMEQADSEQFALAEAVTTDINGVRVLIVQGIYQRDDEQVFAVYIKADDAGELVQEVYYRAPVSSFQTYLGAVSDAINSITWVERAIAST